MQLEEVNSIPTVIPSHLLTLFSIRSSSIETSHGQLPGEMLEVSGYLCGQFPGRNQNQHLEGVKRDQNAAVLREVFPAHQTASRENEAKN